MRSSRDCSSDAARVVNLKTPAMTVGRRGQNQFVVDAGRGSTMVARKPPPSRFSRTKCPPWYATASRTIARPNPTPPVSRLREASSRTKVDVGIAIGTGSPNLRNNLEATGVPCNLCKLHAECLLADAQFTRSSTRSGSKVTIGSSLGRQFTGLLDGLVDAACRAVHKRLRRATRPIAFEFGDGATTPCAATTSNSIPKSVTGKSHRSEASRLTSFVNS